ncbi:putative UDP-sugar transporter protein SLC35A4 [Lamellibrachia satsuma]|nr:putative UDP-sugar transporter protein SLC35A4 [Lamellibrachia satsuma]
MTVTAENTDPSKDTEVLMPVNKRGDGGEQQKPMSPLVWRSMLVFGVSIYGSFSILVHLTEVDNKLPFSSTSMFLLAEFAKLCISIALFMPEVREKGFKMPSLSYIALFAVPAFLYLITNNLGVQMQTEMDPATYQVLANMKILSTALLYRIIIKKPITPLQWGSLGLLAVAGVLNSYGGFKAKSGEIRPSEIHVTLKGLVMITVYCFLSGLAGVYSEYILKKKYETSIHLQNALLYSFGCILNGSVFLLTALNSNDPATNLNLFHGYSIFTWILVLTQAVAGLIMSSIIKHGSNITRLFFIACAMLVTTTLSILIFGLQLNTYFCAAFVIVIVALYLHQK